MQTYVYIKNINNILSIFRNHNDKKALPEV